MNDINIVHCFFEQSGTFKNQFIELGFKAYDYDILNNFGETNFQLDLFCEIDKYFNDEDNIFYHFSTNDLIIAFYPCIRFTHVSQFLFKCNAPQFKNLSGMELMLKEIEFHNQLNDLYVHLCKLVYICFSNNYRLIIENPYNSQHYLVKYWCIPASIIDMDRTKDGDVYIKPTQYFFINCSPEHNFLFDPIPIIQHKKILYEDRKKRSDITPMYANRFIRKYIIPGDIYE